MKWLRTILCICLLSALANWAPREVKAASVIYVNDDATGANDGTSWADAYTDLQVALAAAQSGDQIWVAAGVYYPTSGPNPNRNLAFTLANGVAIYGGFAGTESSLNQRDWQANPTILSGDIDSNDVNADGNFIAETCDDVAGNNSYNVVRGNGVDSTAILDGFIITAGRANSNGPGYYGEGGGIYLTSNARPTLRNLRLSGSRVYRGGGGLSATAGSSPTLTDVTFTGNCSDLRGGGLYVVDGAATLTDVTFEGNRANGSNLSGGGLYADNSTLTLSQVAFLNNDGDSGGGAFIYNGSTATLENVTFQGNTAKTAGGAYISNSTVTISNSSFLTNTATRVGGGGNGGGMYVYPTSPITLTNVTFISNTAQSSGGGIYLFKDNTLVGTDLTFRGNEAGDSSGGGLAGVKSNVTLTRAVFENNTADGGGGLYLGDSSWGSSTAVLEDVVFTGNTAASEGGGIEFVWGNLTIRRGLIANNTVTSGSGGGLHLSGSATTATLENVTVSGNSANSGFGGGGIHHHATSLTLRHVTIADNTNQYDSGQGAGLYVVSSDTPLTMVNSILANNGNEDFRRSSTTSAMSVRYSLIENQGNAGLTHGVDGNIIGQDPLLGPLANNGGFSATHALLLGSPAIDAGDDAEGLTTDQRGVSRPQGNHVDMGAFEAPPTLYLFLPLIIR